MSIKHLLVLGALITCSLSISAQEAYRVEYYSTVPFRETPFADMIGINPLSKKEALERNHYRFEYDRKGQLIRSGFYLANQLRGLNHTANHFFQSPLMAFSYSKNQEIRHFFDKHQNPIEVRGAVFEEVYDLDEKGQRVRLRFRNKEGKWIQNAWDIAEYKWDILPDGRVIEERFDQKGKLVSIRPGFHFYRIRFHYDHRGMLALMQNIDENGELVENDSGAAQDKIEYDDRGNVLAWNVLDKNDQLTRGNSPDVARGVMTYDKYGYEVGIRHEDEKGNLIVNAYGFCMSETEFDRFGNMQARTFLGTDQKAAPHQLAGYTHLRMEWSRDGLDRLRLTYFDENKKTIKHQQRGYAQVRQTYDEQHNMISLTYLDENAKPVSRSDNGISSIEFLYDEQGKLLSRKVFK
jgi:hypothetical protein